MTTLQPLRSRRQPDIGGDARDELRRLVAYHRDLAEMACTYTSVERRMHRHVAALLDSCDPTPTESQNPGEPTNRVHILTQITAAIGTVDDDNIRAHLTAARTIITAMCSRQDHLEHL